MRPLEPAPQHDAWYESEELTRIGLVAELQRIKRRTLVRPIQVILLAGLITSAVTYKLATRPAHVESQVVLALTEGSLSNHHTNIPVDELRDYVTSVLMPDAKLLEVIEQRNLFPLRKKQGDQYAIEELRSQLSVEIWKNSFVFYDEDDSHAEHSARIGLTISDTDPSRAYDLAHTLAMIVIATSEASRQNTADAVSKEVGVMRDEIAKRMTALSTTIATKQNAYDAAQDRGDTGVAAVLKVDLAALDHEQRRNDQLLAQIVTSKDAIADRVVAAGLDLSLAIVEEHRPETPPHSDFVLILIAVVVGTGALIGSALILGAFDARIHDSEDVERLGLPVLGHVPGFPGDRVGSLEARGGARARVPSFLRWRSHQ